MDQTTVQIEADIKGQQEELRSHFEELERKVKSMTDWRQFYQNHTGLMLGVAFSAGALLAFMRGEAGRRRTRSSDATYAPLEGDSRIERQEGQGNWTKITSALVGVAATRFSGFLGRLMDRKKAEAQRPTRTDSAGRENAYFRNG